MSLTVEIRENTGKGANRQLRMTGLTPGVIYSAGGNINVKMRADYAGRFLDSFHGSVKAVEIELLDGKKSSKKNVIIKDAQYSAWGDRLLHVDFMEVTPETIVKVNIPIAPTSDCAALKLGGVLPTIRRSIPVKGMIKDIPEVLVADISELEHEDSLHVLDLKYPEGVVPIVAGRNFTVLVIAGKMKSAAVEDEVEAAEGEEPAADAAAAE